MSTNGRRDTSQREKAFKEFNEGKWHILVSTDLSANGLNFVGVKHVVSWLLNLKILFKIFLQQILFELPPLHRSNVYVHRVGRIGRSGSADGDAWILFDPTDPLDLQYVAFLYKVGNFKSIWYYLHKIQISAAEVLKQASSSLPGRAVQRSVGRIWGIWRVRGRSEWWEWGRAGGRWRRGWI